MSEIISFIEENIIAIFALIFSLFSMIINNERAKVVRQRALNDLVKDYHCEKFRKAREFVLYELEKKYTQEKALSYDEIYREEDEHGRYVRKCSFFFDEIGMHVAHGNLNIHALNAFIGRAILNTFAILDPYLRATRINENDTYYQKHFEHLAALIFKPQSKLGIVFRKAWIVLMWSPTMICPKFNNQDRLAKRLAFGTLSEKDIVKIKSHENFRRIEKRREYRNA